MSGNQFNWHDNASARTMQQRRMGNIPSVRPRLRFRHSLVPIFLVALLLLTFIIGIWVVLP